MGMKTSTEGASSGKKEGEREEYMGTFYLLGLISRAE